MLRFLKRVLMFRIGQKSSRYFARKLGMKWPIVAMIGVVGGFKYMRRHS
jgi:hypothetical protein